MEGEKTQRREEMSHFSTNFVHTCKIPPFFNIYLCWHYFNCVVLHGNLLDKYVKIMIMETGTNATGDMEKGMLI